MFDFFQGTFAYHEESRLYSGSGNSGGHANEKESFHWNYQENGPDMWANKVEKCRGKKQSPLNIDTNYVEYDVNLKPFLFHNYDLNLNWNMSHNGHTGKHKFLECLTVRKV